MTSRGRIALVILIAGVYAVCYSAIKAGLAYAPPLGYAGLRALIAGAALLAYQAARRRPLFPPQTLWWTVVAIALVGTTLGFGAMFLSPGRTGAGIASVLGNTEPLMIVGLAAAFLHEPVTRGKTAALVLAFTGVSLIAYPGLARPNAYGLAGLLLPLVAAAGAAAESVIVKRKDVRNDVPIVAAWQLLLGSAPLLGVSMWFERAHPVVWSPIFVGLLLFLALAGTAFTTALWYWLIQQDDVGRLSLMLFLAPVFGLVLAAALFGERIGRFEVAGVVLAVAGVKGITAFRLVTQPLLSRHSALARIVPIAGQRYTTPVRHWYVRRMQLWRHVWSTEPNGPSSGCTLCGGSSGLPSSWAPSPPTRPFRRIS